MIRNNRKGFTLSELLVVVTIIGLLSTIATVSFTSSRMKARDGRRLADMDAIRKALEIHAIDTGGYPSDKTASGGLVLGSADAKIFTEYGWGSAGGRLYLQNVPANPKPGGVDYRYYSLNNDGSHCAVSPCSAYRVEYLLETNFVGLAAGPYVLGPTETRPAPPDLAPAIIARSSPTAAATAVSRLGPAVEMFNEGVDQARQATIDNPAVEQAAQNIVAPVSTAAVVVSTAGGLSSAASGVATAVSGVGSAVSGALQTATTATAATATSASAMSQLGALFYLLFTQPLLLLRKRKEYSWGVVYDSQKKLPVDLAIVRLLDTASGRVAQTRVTDKEGRIFFFAPKGNYRIEVTKPGYVFPSQFLAGEKEDGRYANLYFGGNFSVPKSGTPVNPSVPLDPADAAAPDRDFVKRYVRTKLRYGISLAGFFLTLGSFAAKPSYLLAAFLVLHLTLYYVFRRLAYPRSPIQWGSVTDEKTKRPISHAVVRLFTAPYDKLVETRVADRRGRYNFIVGQNIYYVTATHEGYWKTESYPLDLRGTDKPQVLSAPLAMRPKSLPAAGRNGT